MVEAVLEIRIQSSVEQNAEQRAVVEVLVGEFRPDEREVSPDGHSLLWLAAVNADCVALLLDRGADINLRNSEVYELRGTRQRPAPPGLSVP
jgi:hypothetical protein